MSKGSTRRPFNITEKKFQENWDLIFGNKQKQELSEGYNKPIDQLKEQEHHERTSSTNSPSVA